MIKGDTDLLGMGKDAITQFASLCVKERKAALCVTLRTFADEDACNQHRNTHSAQMAYRP